MPIAEEDGAKGAVAECFDGGVGAKRAWRGAVYGGGKRLRDKERRTRASIADVESAVEDGDGGDAEHVDGVLWGDLLWGNAIVGGSEHDTQSIALRKGRID